MIEARNELENSVVESSAALTALTEAENQSAIQPFLLGVHENITHPENTYFEFWMGVLGYIIGAVSTASAYPLAADEITQIAEAASIEGLFATIPEVIFGILALALTAFLVALPTQSEFKLLARYLLGTPQLPEADDRLAQRRSALVAAMVIAPFTGLPFAYLLTLYFSNIPVLNIVVPFTAIISSHCACLSVEKAIIHYYFTQTAPKNNLRMELLSHFDSAVQNIKAKNNLEFCAFYWTLYIFDATNSKDQKALKSLKKIFAETSNENGIEVSGRMTLTSTSAGKYLLDGGILIMGALSTFVFYTPAYDFNVAALSYFGMGATDAREGLAISVAVISIGSNCIFDAMYAKYDSDYIYAAIRRGQRKPSWQAIVAHAGAALSSLPSLYLAPAGIGFAIPVFIGSTLARALTFNAMLDILGDYFAGKNAPRSMRSDFNSQADMIRQGLQTAPSELLQKIKNNLITPRAANSFFVNHAALEMQVTPEQNQTPAPHSPAHSAGPA